MDPGRRSPKNIRHTLLRRTWIRKHWKSLKNTFKMQWNWKNQNYGINMSSGFTCWFHRWFLHICSFFQSTDSDRWLSSSSVMELVFLWRNSGHRGHKNPSKCAHCGETEACKSHSSADSWRMLWTSPSPNTTNIFPSLSIKKIIFCWRQK